MSNGEVASSGIGGFLEGAKLNIVEFAILAAFWVAVAIVSSFVGLDTILSERSPLPPVASITLSHLPCSS